MAPKADLHSVTYSAASMIYREYCFISL